MRYYLKARNGIWQIRWTDGAGRPQFKSTGTRDRQLADKELEAFRIKNAQQRDQKLSETTLDTVMVRYWEHHGSTRFAKDVIRRVVKLCAVQAPCLTLDRLTIAEQERIIEGLSPGTARRYLGVVRAALEWSASRQEIERAPRIKRIEVDDGPGSRPYSLDELKRLMAAAVHEHERRLIAVLVSTGCRPSAALDLTWSRVNAAVADFNVPGRRRTKKRRARAPLPPSIAAWLESRRGLGPVIQWNGRGMKGHKMTFQRIAERAGIDGTAYGIRKGLATWLRQQNVPEWEVGALLGHRVASATTERYAHHRPDYMRATVAAVEALLAQIRPSWLGIPEAPVQSPSGTGMRIRLVSNDLAGSREWDRTTDHFHVKEAEPEWFQRLKPANDDK